MSLSAFGPLPSVSSTGYRPPFSLVFVEEALAVAFDPVFEVAGGLLELVGVDEAAAQRLEEGARAHVVGELVVSLVRRPLGRRDEELFVERGEPALDAA